MALRHFATQAATFLRVRCAGPPSLSMTFFRSWASAVEVDAFKFAPSHEWVKVEGDTAIVGISDHAQKELGDVVFVDLPHPGDKVTKGEAFGVVESVKAASDVYSPVSGEIVEVNEELRGSPALVNNGPHSEGWMLKVKLSDTSELDSLLDAKAYENHVETTSAH